MKKRDWQLLIVIYLCVLSGALIGQGMSRHFNWHIFLLSLGAPLFVLSAIAFWKIAR